MTRQNWPAFAGEFPGTRLRRTRKHAWSRGLIQENHLRPADLIWPVFVREPNVETLIPSMPGVGRYTIDELLKAAEMAVQRGIQALMLFPYSDAGLKSDDAAHAYDDQNLICRALRALKKEKLPLGLITDLALDPYTTHGHDGLVDPQGEEGWVLNDETNALLLKQGLAFADAGADMVAPSDMMDGRIGALRQGLDGQGYEHVGIISYAAKYASAFYGPFRDAVGSKAALKKAQKVTYQMDPANGNEAMREVFLDIQEGADMVIVKPAGPYLDIVRRVKEAFCVPLLAYQVSGEYAMIMAASEKGWLCKEAAMMESLLSFKRAGADGIITYFAPEAALCLTNS